MKTKSLIGLMIGLVLLSLLVSWQGLGTVAGVLGEAGWAVLLICLFAAPSQLIGAEAWRCLFPRERRPGTFETWMASWMGSAVNTLLPVATIGGEVVKARVLALNGHSGTDTVSSMVVDKTVQAISILIWALVGIAMLTQVAPDEKVIRGAVIGAVLLALGIGGFIGVQLLGSFSFFAKIGIKAGNKAGTSDKWRGIVGSAADVDAAIKAIYKKPGAITIAVFLRLADRVLLVGEVLLAAHLMGHPIGIAEAVMIKGLVAALRGVSFAIPAGLGVQEGGYIGLGLLVGLPPDLMLAVSLASRVREILPNIPFLFVWQHLEGRALLRRARE
ncbi:MAG: lysylphosphatidylglycerol synthase domain-containing protein [Rhodospirillales bacterium]|nr:lysylphosphatidylglycerol synthase domain-containing protein [Rhodospirillales bacterium]